MKIIFLTVWMFTVSCSCQPYITSRMIAEAENLSAKKNKELKIRDVVFLSQKNADGTVTTLYRKSSEKYFNNPYIKRMESEHPSTRFEMHSIEVLQDYVKNCQHPKEKLRIVYDKWGELHLNSFFISEIELPEQKSR